MPLRERIQRTFTNPCRPQRGDIPIRIQFDVFLTFLDEAKLFLCKLAAPVETPRRQETARGGDLGRQAVRS